jgi:hypothetical protein
MLNDGMSSNSESIEQDDLTSILMGNSLFLDSRTLRNQGEYLRKVATTPRMNMW